MKILYKFITSIINLSFSFNGTYNIYVIKFT